VVKKLFTTQLIIVIMKIETIKKYGFAISLIAFPIMLLTGFLMHPHLLKLGTGNS